MEFGGYQLGDWLSLGASVNALGVILGLVIGVLLLGNPRRRHYALATLATMLVAALLWFQGARQEKNGRLSAEESGKDRKEYKDRIEEFSTIARRIEEATTSKAQEPVLQAQQLAAGILAHSAECDSKTRSILYRARDLSGEELQRNTRELEQAMADCQDAYARRYAGPALALHDQLLALGAKEQLPIGGIPFDHLARFPTNPLGMREVAVTLSAMGEGLRMRAAGTPIGP